MSNTTHEGDPNETDLKFQLLDTILPGCIQRQTAVIDVRGGNFLTPEGRKELADMLKEQEQAIPLEAMETIRGKMYIAWKMHTHARGVLWDRLRGKEPQARDGEPVSVVSFRLPEDELENRRNFLTTTRAHFLMVDHPVSAHHRVIHMGGSYFPRSSSALSRFGRIRTANLVPSGQEFPHGIYPENQGAALLLTLPNINDVPIDPSMDQTTIGNMLLTRALGLARQGDATLQFTLRGGWYTMQGISLGKPLTAARTDALLHFEGLDAHGLAKLVDIMGHWMTPEA